MKAKLWQIANGRPRAACAEALKEQLAIGGHLVIPVGEQDRYQNLLKTCTF